MFGTQQVTMTSPRLTVNSYFRRENLPKSLAEGEKLNVMSMSQCFSLYTPKNLSIIQPLKRVQDANLLLLLCVLSCPCSTSLLGQLLALALGVQGSCCSVNRRECGREGGRQRGQMIKGGSWQRSLAVSESQRCAYHCLSLIHHDRHRERLNKQERKGDGEENKGEARERWVNTDKDNRKFLSITHCNHDSWRWWRW